MKKIILGLLSVIVIISIISVYYIGGKIGAYVWCAAVFVLAPVAILATLIQIINLAVRICRRREVVWNFAFIVISIVYAIPIVVLLGVSPITYPTNANEDDSIEVMMPVENAVLFGGKEYKTHAMWPSECYAYDVLKEPYEVGSSNLNDYGIFGENIRCPITGTVIAIENNEPDIIPNIEEFTSSLGNYIFLKVDKTDTYIILAHLKQNSILVSVGDHVDEGILIGQVGNSGTTSEPHIHIQHQRENPLDVKIPICAEGLPIAFKND